MLLLIIVLATLVAYAATYAALAARADIRDLWTIYWHSPKRATIEPEVEVLKRRSWDSFGGVSGAVSILVVLLVATDEKWAIITITTNLTILAIWIGGALTALTVQMNRLKKKGTLPQYA